MKFLLRNLNSAAFDLRAERLLLENKQRLILAGVAAEILTGFSGMDPIHKQKLRKNHVVLEDHVVFAVIRAKLVEDDILDKHMVAHIGRGSVRL